MNLASLELCKELWSRTGWVDTAYTWRLHHPSGGQVLLLTAEKRADEERYRHQPKEIADRFLVENAFYPAYGLGYLLRKLPYYIDTKDTRGTFELFIKKTSKEYHAGYNKPELGKWLDDNNHGVWETPCNAYTPEDAAAKLCIELFEQGILK